MNLTEQLLELARQLQQGYDPRVIAADVTLLAQRYAPVPEQNRTPAQYQAAVLRAVASHLDVHPDLLSVNFSSLASSGGQLVEMQLVGGNGVVPLLAWAESLHATELHVRRPGAGTTGWCHLHIDSQIDGWPVRVWSAVYDLEDSDLADGSTLDVADLAVAVGLAGNLAVSLCDVQLRKREA